MSYRKFTDRSGAVWQVKDETLNRWVFDPVPGNPGDPRAVAAPTYTDDPFEMSEGELQRLLDKARPSGGPGKAAWPFKDDPPAGL
jgi:hypothetical protein